MFVVLSEIKSSSGQILTKILSDLYTDHLTSFLRLLLDLHENAHNLWNTDFYFHGCFPFLYRLMGKILLRERRPFFCPQNLHKTLHTTPYLVTNIFSS